MIFTLQNSYISGTTHVYLNGIRLTPGLSYDYIETIPDQIEFNYPLFSTDQLIVDYKISI